MKRKIRLKTTSSDPNFTGTLKLADKRRIQKVKAKKRKKRNQNVLDKLVQQESSSDSESSESSDSESGTSDSESSHSESSDSESSTASGSEEEVDPPHKKEFSKAFMVAKERIGVVVDKIFRSTAWPTHGILSKAPFFGEFDAILQSDEVDGLDEAERMVLLLPGTFCWSNFMMFLR